MLYELRNLKKDYGKRTVLDLPDLSLDRGKVIGLLGPNGAGKTTLLEILSFLSAPTAGEVRFNDRWVDFNNNKLVELRQRVVVVQQHPIMFTATVLKNLEFPLRIRKVPKQERERIVEELLDLVGLRELAQARAHNLSGGETQRAAIARALACFPEVIFFDEPTANVDMENQIAIERLIQEINRAKGISVIFTTHNMIQASRLADEIVFLFDGRQARSTYENIFSGSIEVTKNGQKHCVVQNRLRLAVQEGAPGPVRIAIDPGAMKIGKILSATLPENSFEGRLLQLTDEESRVRALVDVGIPLSILIPKEEFNTMSLGMGEAVWLTCPPESIEFI
jgi:tungstate transport system ATP-binding protein